MSSLREPASGRRGWALSGFLVLLGLTGPLVVGCGVETPSISSSEEKATVKGFVTVEGKQATKGTITFDPSNANRRMAPVVSSKLGPDGSFSVETLVGRNVVSFDLPGLATPKNKLNYARLNCEVKSGENTFEAALPPK